MNWDHKLNNWENGEDLLFYPKNITKAFIWETSPVYKNISESKFEEVFIENESLENAIEDSSPFNKYLTDSKNVVSFENLRKDCTLVVPIPRENKKYTSIKLFIDNASVKQQKKFWKRVAKEIRDALIENDKVWVSTHGLGVYYLHVRIDTYPKYYKTERFKN